MITFALFCRDNLYPEPGVTVIVAASRRSFVWSNIAVKVKDTESEPGGIVIWPLGAKLLLNV